MSLFCNGLYTIVAKLYLGLELFFVPGPFPSFGVLVFAAGPYFVTKVSCSLQAVIFVTKPSSLLQDFFLYKDLFSYNSGGTSAKSGLILSS
jgi:hypothetical protein